MESIRTARAVRAFEQVDSSIKYINIRSGLSHSLSPMTRNLLIHA